MKPRKDTRKIDQIKEMKVNQIEIIESLDEPDPNSRRFVDKTRRSNIIPTNLAYGKYILDDLGNFIYLQKTGKVEFGVRSKSIEQLAGGNDILSARKQSQQYWIASLFIRKIYEFIN